ncbi:hypothetical protein [Aquitalea denitrificans]|uniref:hypothetical protein n=1 Tax=Aquitalea denitrificans TaxID=519081 RepID=UPI00135A08E7|nr:hypothetical protein [Aquitalea denitrificans]
MPAIHLKYPPLRIRAGSHARMLLQQQGLQPAMVACLPGAAGGPKAIGLCGLDQAVFGWLAENPRPRELVGASIGSWRFACAMQANPQQALARLAERYTAECYADNVSIAGITAQTRLMLQDILGSDGLQAILRHPHYRLSLLLVASHGLLRHETPGRLLSGLAISATLNLASRNLLQYCFSRMICHDARSSLHFMPDDGLPTHTLPLDAHNLTAALMGSVAIPGVLHGVALPGVADGPYRDGGLLDYHLDLPFARQNDITLYPHFGPRIVPGWFDKFMPWRQHSARNHRNTILLCPAADYLARLPGGKLPDRSDFKRHRGNDRLRQQQWRTARSESQRLGDAWLEWLARGCPLDMVEPL